ncbi:helicase associated domain-containing protein [Gordonia sihwensis]|uniref:helicase associated domain-containing protein n=1 Tax=Gordonia sihwensis TaxID=173559 RepID=UPI003D95C998
MTALIEEAGTAQSRRRPLAKPQLRTFDDGLELLVRFVTAGGPATPPRNAVFENLPIGSWVHYQRALYRRGALGEREVQRLAQIPGWAWDVRAARTESALAALHEFVARYGHARPVRGARINGINIGLWVQNRRRENRVGALDPALKERIEREFPDFVWDGNRAIFEVGLEFMRSYYAETGSSYVPVDTCFEGFWLGHWCRKVRAKIAAGELDSELVSIIHGEFHDWTK